ncbi:hypothetical protein [Cryobacterium sp. BB736]|uniref:hypothetical protein n=1 Tax=Cryobacterium sp. BB736 TaxID=2746963 RepID=UPI00187684CD|nr:hypothetical protein [Cryobacterium sp. BB736]
MQLDPARDGNRMNRRSRRRHEDLDPFATDLLERHDSFRTALLNGEYDKHAWDMSPIAGRVERDQLPDA